MSWMLWVLAGCGSAVDLQDTLSVVNISPGHGSVGVALDTDVVVTFDGDIDVELEGRVGLQAEDGTDVELALSWAADSYTVTAVPSATLAPETTYTLTLDSTLGSAQRILGATITTAFQTEATGDTGATETDTGRPAWCPEPEAGLQQVDGTDGSPYLVHHPASAGKVPVVMFLGGGPGDLGSAQISWEAFLAGGEDVDEYLVVLPYDEASLAEATERMYGLVDELVSCFDADPERIHLAGTSRGGYTSFSMMLERPELFATLLGAPGLFSDPEEEELTTALLDKRVFMGVGSEDGSWISSVESQADSLDDLGIDVTYWQFEGEGHVPGPDFDPTPLFDFWATP